ncbi:MAG: hypothetical protein ACOX60_06250 [Massiliimalia sp.]|jgi:hypothetical protein
MDEYINKEEALNEIRRKCICGYLPFRSNTPEGIMIYEVIRVIDSMPAADVRPVVRGKWVKTDVGIYECSICAHPETVHEVLRYNFCPNCGADMRGEQK